MSCRSWDTQAAGHVSLNAIGGRLDARKVAVPNGGRWRHVQVRQILARASGSVGDRYRRPAALLSFASGLARCFAQPECEELGAGLRLISVPYAKGYVAGRRRGGRA
jgi:hypothetical protein